VATTAATRRFGETIVSWAGVPSGSQKDSMPAPRSSGARVRSEPDWALEVHPVKLHYVNMLAIPAWVLFSSKWLDRDDTQSVGRSLELWDRVGVRLTRSIERRVPPPVGLNLFCVASKV
jgi:hypothetical protein